MGDVWIARPSTWRSLAAPAIVPAQTRFNTHAWRVRNLGPDLPCAPRGDGADVAVCPAFARAPGVVRVGGKDVRDERHTDMSDPQILWSGSEDRALQLPERQLLDAIASGELDDHLIAIADAVHAVASCCTRSARRQPSRNYALATT
jgi:hypothetical protein